MLRDVRASATWSPGGSRSRPAALLRRGREAGLDVMGDGRYVAYAGGVRRRELPGQTALMYSRRSRRSWGERRVEIPKGSDAAGRRDAGFPEAAS